VCAPVPGPGNVVHRKFKFKFKINNGAEQIKSNLKSKIAQHGCGFLVF